MNKNPLVVKKVIKASRNEVFEAFTKPEIMSKWFFPGEDYKVDVTNTLEVGGSYSLIMHAYNGEKYKHTGVYREIAPPEKLVFTWDSDFVSDTVVSILFRELGESTEVTIIHDLLSEGEMKDNHEKGWKGALDNLDRLFA